MAESGWTWDPTLYAGSAQFYAHGRVAYPDSLADALTDELGLDGTGRLLDVGCGPGSLTLLLADRFAAVVGDRCRRRHARRGARAGPAGGRGQCRNGSRCGGKSCRERSARSGW